MSSYAFFTVIFFEGVFTNTFDYFLFIPLLYYLSFYILFDCFLNGSLEFGTYFGD